MRFMLILIILAALSSCAEFGAFRSGVASHGAEASDQALDTAIWTLCNGIPVGAVNRRFKSESEKEAYRKLCPQNELP